MNYKYYIADAFTNQIFNGAQIAVFPNADGLSHLQMKLAAKELHLSETVFVFHEGKDTKRRMRIFTPKGEIDFAGHPVIATAFVLASCGDIELTGTFTPIVFEQNSGPINTNITNDNGKPVFIQFTRKVSPIVDRFAPPDGELASFLSIPQGQIDHKKYNTRLVSCGFPYLVVPVYNYEAVRSAKFNYQAWSESVAPQTAAQEILLFSARTPFQDADFNARLFGPNIGLHDDPPVGTAMPAFAAYLCSFDQLKKGTYTFAVDRGEINTRRSVINLEMDHKREDTLTIRVGGEAVMVAEGTIHVPAVENIS
ncbi:PhzF family phenazine biosynthesis protein [Candidatus Methylobacter favarea]|uniref:PhzF family phenazine biosynthesis protein n=1 Tax=Candidatus Methylobacter favarea TaxID=2707345 RepID=A0A8S0WQC2_9GAMM|nr:PhzF family phenazine biosynthesis protein [Candidatus Methylobacter favarea]CAA9891356.1 PhzF family phenazine biosynthesis protein [Candidatus Methylobacter favarea]